VLLIRTAGRVALLIRTAGRVALLIRTAGRVELLVRNALELCTYRLFPRLYNKPVSDSLLRASALIKFLLFHSTGDAVAVRFIRQVTHNEYQIDGVSQGRRTPMKKLSPE
jgi:hypothetical protein